MIELNCEQIFSKSLEEQLKLIICAAVIPVKRLKLDLVKRPRDCFIKEMKESLEVSAAR